MDQSTDRFQQQRQLYQDMQDTFGTDAGRRVLAWWRRRVTSVVDPGNPNVSHFLLARRVDFDQVERILAADIGELIAALEAQQQESESRVAGGSMESPAGDAWPYVKGQTDGEG